MLKSFYVNQNLTLVVSACQGRLRYHLYLTFAFRCVIVYYTKGDKMVTGQYNEKYKPDVNWKYPANMEMYPRVDKPKPRTGQTRKLSDLVRKAKKQGIIIKAVMVEYDDESVSGKFCVYDLNLSKRLTPYHKTVSECTELLGSFLKGY